MGIEHDSPISASAPASPYPAQVPPTPRPRRLTRSSSERLWAGVAGGFAEYFDLDPSLVRLLWIAATVVSSGLGVAVYILAWILLPRDDRPSVGRTPAPEHTTPPQDWWASEQYVEQQRMHGHHSRSTGIVLVALGVLLLAANAGLFAWIDLRTMWPLIFIGLGLILLGRQSGWRR